MIYSVENLVARKGVARGRRGAMWLTWWGGMEGANDGREKRKIGEGRERTDRGVAGGRVVTGSRPVEEGKGQGETCCHLAVDQ